jgi:hypothetical protein
VVEVQKIRNESVGDPHLSNKVEAGEENKLMQVGLPYVSGTSPPASHPQKGEVP